MLETNLWGGKQWSSAERGLWRVRDSVAGEVFELDNLMFIIVRNAGHLLPMDVPATALDMLSRFVGGQGFRDVSLRSDAYYAALTSDLPDSQDEGIKDFDRDTRNRDKVSKITSHDPKRGGKLNTYIVLLIFATVMVASIVFFRSVFRDEEAEESTALLPSQNSSGYQTSGANKVRLPRGS